MVGFLGSSVPRRELQAKHTPTASRPDGAQGGCDAPSTPLQEHVWLPWEGTKGLQWWEGRQQRPVALPYGAPGSGLPALCNPRAAPQLPAEEGSAEPSDQSWCSWSLHHTGGLSSSTVLIPAIGSCKECCLVEAMLGCLWSWALAPVLADLMWWDGSSVAVAVTATLFASRSLCHSASGPTTALF